MRAVQCGLVGILRVAQNDIGFELFILSVILNAVKDPDTRQSSEILHRGGIGAPADLLSAEVIEVQFGLVGILRVAQNDIGFSTVVDEILRLRS